MSDVTTLAHRATAGPTQGFAVWSAAWLAGSAGTDDVLSAVQEWAPRHIVAGGDFADLMTDVRALEPHTARLLLPTPGDVRGLPAGTEVERAALSRGEAAVFDGVASSICVIPVTESEETVRWCAYEAEPALVDPDPVPLGAAELALREAVRAAPAVLANVPPEPGTRADPRRLVTELTRHLGSHRLPLGASERSHRVLDSAALVEAILLVADAHSRVPGVSLASAQGGDDTYRELWRTVRAARVAAVNSICREELRS